MQFLNIIFLLNTLNIAVAVNPLHWTARLVYPNHPILNTSPYKFPKSQTLITIPLKDPRKASLGVSFPSCNSDFLQLTNFKSIWCRLHRFSFKTARHTRSKTNVQQTFPALAPWPASKASQELLSFYKSVLIAEALVPSLTGHSSLDGISDPHCHLLILSVQLGTLQWSKMLKSVLTPPGAAGPDPLWLLHAHFSLLHK